MKRFRNKKHLAYIRTLRCAVSSYACSAFIEAHHLLRPWDGVRGMGMKALDTNAIPLCQHHHRELHKFGNEERFFEHMGYNGDYGKALAKRLWIDSPIHGDSALCARGR